MKPVQAPCAHGGDFVSLLRLQHMSQVRLSFPVLRCTKRLYPDAQQRHEWQLVSWCADHAEGHCRQQAHQQQHQGAAHNCDQPSAWQEAGCSQHCPSHIHCHFRSLLASTPARQPQAASTGTNVCLIWKMCACWHLNVCSVAA